MKGATEELFDKVTYYKRERALGALNGTLLRVSLSASHKAFFLEKRTFEKFYGGLIVGLFYGCFNILKHWNLL